MGTKTFTILLRNKASKGLGSDAGLELSINLG